MPIQSSSERSILNINNEEISSVVGEGVSKYILEEVDKYPDVVLMISKAVEEIYGDKLPKLNSIRGEVTKITLNDGEDLKNIRNYQKIIRILIERKVERDSLFIYIGGGTVGDLAGFVTSTYKRGADLIAVPTTLLAQVDSSIGGKTGINFSSVKNVIGTFYNPKIILSDTNFLRNSSPALLKDGVSEIIKYGVISDHTLLTLLGGHEDLKSLAESEKLIRIISKSIKIKADIVDKDYFDRLGVRAVLNFGHTIGHAIEAATKNAISHGQAIATGMLVESFIAERMGIASPEVRKEIKQQMDRFSISQISLKEVGLDGIMKYMYNDKKVESGAVRLVVPEDLGKTTEIKIELRSFPEHIKTFINSYDPVKAR